MAYAACQPAIRFKKKECINLPPVVTERRQIELSPQQKKVFSTMKNQAIMEAQQHKISAVNAADVLGKLRQICLGVVKNPKTGEYVEIDHSPRTKELLVEIQRAGTKVIVVVPYKGIIQTLEDEIRGAGYSVEIINGDVSRSARTDVINRFRKEKDPYVLLIHPKVAAHGLNLAVASTVIFYGPIFSSDQDTQVKERIARPDQMNQMNIIQFGAGPLEFGIYKVVAERQITQSNILDLYNHVVLGEKPNGSGA
jgi:SNF2 family DNA or RNA helicase